MRTGRFTTIAAILVAHALAATVAAEPPPEITSIKFFAYDYNDKGYIVGQEGVKCVALRSDHAVQLGITNEKGEVSVSYADLFQPGNLAVMFCAPGSGVSCTAIRLDVPHLRGFAEYNVRVTPFEIVDRFQVQGKDHGRKK